MDKPKKFYTKDYMSRPGMSFAIEIADPVQRIEEFMNRYRREPVAEGFEESLMTRDLSVVSATGPPNVTTAVFEMDIIPMYGTRMGNASGAAITLIHDMCTTMAMAPLARQDFWHFGGVSRVLSVTYLRPTKVGTTVLIECEVLQVGARFATIRGSIKDKATGDLLSVCEHNKASIIFRENPKI
ncbi:uncharacterized protein Z520_07433 [Fonsecaea multimorphosa CBS 102226]|uniref:Thioesterase domain-containing protein n=1 Tax=Fonsecaea multimorphosa CBS 102226 TaxID=1442371 RepID=A0A0D2K126_9EURO|nr:uncharacterized protein Z520_07433 [Fonsecaea multimorphosa CBS 102226]KIX96714.1 hypothetical protein Z520_07433 [Fonsecaea multimorphosa CBS 102226]OAL22724.1 hypothetical protein AYO22_06952 [Fonsecaea multimorphosa]